MNIGKECGGRILNVNTVTNINFNMSEKKYPIGGYALLPADDAVQNWFEENIDKECSASSAIYKFRLWLKSLQCQAAVLAHRSQILSEYKQYKENLKYLGGASEWTYDKVVLMSKIELFETIKGFNELITFLDATCYAYEEGAKDWEERCLKAESNPAGAVWVKGAPKEQKQHFARVPSIIEDDVVYDAVIWPTQKADYWYASGNGFNFTIHKDKVIEYLTTP